MMIIHFDKINCIIFFLVQAHLLTVIEADHETLNVKIKNGNEVIELNWKRTGQYLVNQNLPVWYAVKNEEPRILPHVFEGIGDFIMYHDVEKSSAVVYIRNFNCFYGIIDTRFFVAGLPLSHLQSGNYQEVGGDYIIAREGEENARRFHHSPDDWITQIFTNHQIQYVNSVIDSADAMSRLRNPIPHSNRDQHDISILLPPAQSSSHVAHHSAYSSSVRERQSPLQILYPEILVFITHDIYKTFARTGSENFLSWLVLYYISFFNAIDMLFRKLTTEDIAVHINIAGIVIETKQRGLPQRYWQCHQVNLNRISYCHNGHKILSNYAKYIKKYGRIFVEDSFDFFFISTSYAIRFGHETVNGISTSLTDIYKRRTLHSPNENLLGSVVQREETFGDYVTAARELSQLMGIKIDSSRPDPLHGGQLCYAIMQNSQTHCPHCLEWSEQSQNELKAYVRYNRNHCFLLNYPRSLSLYGQPMLSLSPADQCSCYNYPVAFMNPSNMMSVPAGSCAESIECIDGLGARSPTPMPIDGTPCGSPNQVCWRRRCVDVATQQDNRRMSYQELDISVLTSAPDIPSPSYFRR